MVILSNNNKFIQRILEKLEETVKGMWDEGKFEEI